MELLQPPETELLLPPWTKRRRRLAAMAMIGFILLVSGLIGVGIYQVGIEMGMITPALNKKQITQTLLADASFLRAVKQAGRRRECVNQVANFGIAYQAPFRPLATSGNEACKTFVALHPTGSDVLVTITSEAQSRDKLAAANSALFSSVQADLLSGNGFETTRISGVKENILTTIYIIRENNNKSWVISYAPTSPTLDAIVQGMVEQFRIME